MHATLTRAALDERDAALATELVYGTLRHERLLDFHLARLAARPLRKLPPSTLAALRLGAYQLLMTRIADHGAVHDTVTLVRRQHAYQAGFVNALLRELARQRDAGTLADPRATIADPLEALAVATSHPAWVLHRVTAELGRQEAEAFALADNETPPLALRLNPLRMDAAMLAAHFAEAGLALEAVAGVPGAFTTRGAGTPARLPGFAAGAFTVQDPAAQLVGHLASPAPGSFVVDACAAPGGKTTHLAEIMQNRGRLLAFDIHPGKTRLVAESAARLGLSIVHAASADATDLAALRAHLGPGGGPPDMILVDAPCSGVGTLRRHPELRGRSEAELAGLVALQDRLLDATAAWLEPGGILIYAVCSVTPEEGPERVRAFLARTPSFRLAPPPVALLEPYLAPLDGGRVLRTWPHRHGMDGFFGARLIRI